MGQELRNDLIPYIDTHYATYADCERVTADTENTQTDTADGGENTGETTASYDLSASRSHRAMAGLSMGGMQTINIGMCECLDIISYFGAFSAAPTSYKGEDIVKTIDTQFPDEEILYFTTYAEPTIPLPIRALPPRQKSSRS